MSASGTALTDSGRASHLHPTRCETAGAIIEARVMASHLAVSRIVPVVAHAIAVFGDEHKASHWLSTPLPLFDNRTPSELLESDEGIDLVERTLTRIEHNIPS